MVYSIKLDRPTTLRYSIYEKVYGLGHINPRKFGIALSISPKPVKLDTSSLVSSFAIVLPIRRKYNISERGRGLGHVTRRKVGIPGVYL